MGTLNFTVGKLGRTAKHIGAGAVMATAYRTSDAFTTTTSATYVEDGSGDISIRPGEIIQLWPSEDMWIRFGAVAAVGDGFFLPSDQPAWFEYDPDVSAGGSKAAALVSVIDVA